MTKKLVIQLTVFDENASNEDIKKMNGEFQSSIHLRSTEESKKEILAVLKFLSRTFGSTLYEQYKKYYKI